MRSKFLIFSALLILFSANAFGQSGGNFTVTESVIAGGGQQLTGGNFALDGTAGQSVAGNASSNAPFAVTSGFWNFTPLAPTAANALIGGRILTADGAGIRSAILLLTDISGGQTRIARSGNFGYYRFEDVPVGEIYILTIRSKRFSFVPATRIITPLEELTDIDFTALPR